MERYYFAEVMGCLGYNTRSLSLQGQDAAGFPLHQKPLRLGLECRFHLSAKPRGKGDFR